MKSFENITNLYSFSKNIDPEFIPPKSLIKIAIIKPIVLIICVLLTIYFILPSFISGLTIIVTGKLINSETESFSHYVNSTLSLLGEILRLKEGFNSSIFFSIVSIISTFYLATILAPGGNDKNRIHLKYQQFIDFLSYFQRAFSAYLLISFAYYKELDNQIFEYLIFFSWIFLALAEFQSFSLTNGKNRIKLQTERLKYWGEIYRKTKNSLNKIYWINIIDPADSLNSRIFSGVRFSLALRYSFFRSFAPILFVFSLFIAAIFNEGYVKGEGSFRAFIIYTPILVIANIAISIFSIWLFIHVNVTFFPNALVKVLSYFLTWVFSLLQYLASLSIIIRILPTFTASHSPVFPEIYELISYAFMLFIALSFLATKILPSGKILEDIYQTLILYRYLSEKYKLIKLISLNYEV